MPKSNLSGASLIRTGMIKVQRGHRCGRDRDTEQERHTTNARRTLPPAAACCEIKTRSHPRGKPVQKFKKKKKTRRQGVGGRGEGGGPEMIFVSVSHKEKIKEKKSRGEKGRGFKPSALQRVIGGVQGITWDWGGELL